MKHYLVKDLLIRMICLVRGREGFAKDLYYENVGGIASFDESVCNPEYLMDYKPFSYTLTREDSFPEQKRWDCIMGAHKEDDTGIVYVWLRKVTHPRTNAGFDFLMVLEPVSENTKSFKPEDPDVWMSDFDIPDEIFYDEKAREAYKLTEPYKSKEDYLNKMDEILKLCNDHTYSVPQYMEPWMVEEKEKFTNPYFLEYLKQYEEQLSGKTLCSNTGTNTTQIKDNKKSEETTEPKKKKKSFFSKLFS